MAEFEAAYEKRVVPILKRHGLGRPAERVAPSSRGVFSRLFEVSDDFDPADTWQALRDDPDWTPVATELSETLQFQRRLINLEVYSGPAGAGTTMPAGSGKTVPVGKGMGLWTTFDATDGLTSGTTVAIYQDRDGYLWFGGRFGLCRYDGREFTSYTDKDFLGHHDIRSIIQDRDGNMWFGTDGGGLTRFDPSETVHEEAWTTYTRATA